MEYKYKPEEIPISKESKRSLLIWRPVIPIILMKGKNLVGYEALIDTGADYNIFHSDISTILGIKLSRGRKRNIYGLGGQVIKGYIHQIELKPVGMSPFNTSAVFSSQIPNHSLGVLGNVGFLDHFKIIFNYKQKTITLY